MDVTVAGLFLDSKSAETAIEMLIEAGYARDCISVVAKGNDKSAEDEIEEVEEHPPGEETLGDAMAGGVLGGILGLAAGVATVVLPGSLVVIGPLAGLLGGTALGATAGAIVGSLWELGLDDEEAHGFVTSIEAGAVVVAVHAKEQSFHRPERILLDAGATDVHVIYPES